MEQVFDFNSDFFTLFGLPRVFRLDLAQLESAYRALQARFHPDRAVTLPDAERRFALQAATRINEAYQALKAPLARGRYLLSLAGVDTQEETNTAMPMDFLMQQMEWREEIAEARAASDVDALERVATLLTREVKQMESSLALALDEQTRYQDAALLVRKLKFMEKLEREVDDAIDALLD
jgi:molecular chaperone HscB